MIRGCVIIAAAGLGCAAAVAGDNPVIWGDVAGDAMIRRTDPSMTGELGPDCSLPNLLRLKIGGWESATPSSNPYNGNYHDPETAHLIRFDLELRGVINPPGTAMLSSYSPFAFGPSPLFGFIEFDIDGDRDSGGELGAAAKNRYLSNVSRFGRAPYGSIGERAPKFGWEVDSVFATAPQFERSGAEFVLSFCGCFTPTIVSEGGNGNGRFDAGETWIVRGGFFQRAGGFQSICSSFGGAGGLQPGLYSPYVNLRWSHAVETNITTVTLIFAGTTTGAGQLAGQAPQPVNLSAGDQASIVEALDDLIHSAPLAPVSSPVWYLANRWQGEDPTDPRYREPHRWDVQALVGTVYAAPVDDAVFVWTDTGFSDTRGDLNGDGLLTALDKQVVFTALDSLDGTERDGEGVGSENGNVQLINPGLSFALADVNGDGNINRFDVNSLCQGDFNQDGVINVADYVNFFNAFNLGDPRADLNLNGTLDTSDFVAFLNAIAAGC